MNKKRLLYIFFVSLAAFVVWLIGEAIIIANGLSMTAARVWVVVIFSAACVWSIVHFYRADKKEKEDEENDKYKGVY
jgi:membrane protein implicated in regulation of membrane protease activity